MTPSIIVSFCFRYRCIKYIKTFLYTHTHMHLHAFVTLVNLITCDNENSHRQAPALKAVDPVKHIT